MEQSVSDLSSRLIIHFLRDRFLGFSIAQTIHSFCVRDRTYWNGRLPAGWRAVTQYTFRACNLCCFYLYFVCVCFAIEIYCRHIELGITNKNNIVFCERKQTKNNDLFAHRWFIVKFTWFILNLVCDRSFANFWIIWRFGEFASVAVANLKQIRNEIIFGLISIWFECLCSKWLNRRCIVISST